MDDILNNLIKQLNPNFNNLLFPYSEDINHWEMRKILTLEGYTSDSWGMLTYKLAEVSHSFSKDTTEFRQNYEKSVKFYYNNLLSVYKTVLPPKNYRRTSINCDIVQNDSNNLGAFVRKENPEKVLLNTGTILAIEDAAQTYSCMVNFPCGIHFNTIGLDHMISLRLEKELHQDSFIKYFKKKELSPDSEHPLNFIVQNFLIISKIKSRQILGDKISILSQQWLIGHEDAHIYSGHLHHFIKMNIAEDDDILLSELISTIENKEYLKKRRAAELEADTRASFRIVDYAFSKELYEIFALDFEEGSLHKINEKTSQSINLSSLQRRLLVRLLICSAALPLIVFHGAFNNNPYNNHLNYPSLITRLFNIAYCVLKRAVDVSFQRPQYNIGSFTFKEISEIFKNSIEDLVTLYETINWGLLGEVPENLTQINEKSDSITNSLYMLLLTNNGSFNMLNRNTKIGKKDLDELGLIWKLLVSRKQMLECEIIEFYKSKIEANGSRVNKTCEDRFFAERELEIMNNYFSWE